MCIFLLFLESPDSFNVEREDISSGEVSQFRLRLGVLSDGDEEAERNERKAYGDEGIELIGDDDGEIVEFDLLHY